MASAPTLEGLDEQYGEDRFLQVMAWSDGDEASMAEFTEQHGMTFPNIAADLVGRFERDYGIPSYVLLAPGHELVKVDQGHIGSADIEALIEEHFE